MKLASVLVAATVIAVAAPANAQDGKAAAELFEKGRVLLAAKNYAEACPAFEESQRLDAAIGTQMNIALCYEEWGKIAAAYSGYRQAAKMAAVKGDTVRGDAATKRADALESMVPRLLLRVQGSAVGLDVQVDDNVYVLAALTDPLPLDPGEHKVILRRGSEILDEQTIVLRRSEQKLVELESSTATAVPAPVVVVRRNKTRVITAIAVGSAGLIAAGVGTTLALRAKSDYDEQFNNGACDPITHECATEESFRATTDARKRVTIYSVTAGVGGALLVTGIILFITAPNEATPSAFRVVPALAADQVGLVMMGSF